MADRNEKKLIIAIDGPAASGKGTLARKLASHFGLNHLDTGLTYRAVAHGLTQAGLPLDDEVLALEIAGAIDFGRLDANILSSHEIGEAASKIAIMGKLRKKLVEAQRAFAQNPPGAVLDGRDIGTVVLPEAPIKLYITAGPKIRAQRRFDEIVKKGGKPDLGAILADIERRDARDMARADSPLRPADDAYLIDTTKMDIQAAFEAALEIVSEKALL